MEIEEAKFYREMNAKISAQMEEAHKSGEALGIKTMIQIIDGIFDKAKYITEDDWNQLKLNIIEKFK